MTKGYFDELDAHESEPCVAGSPHMEMTTWGLGGDGMEVVGVKKGTDGMHLRFCLKKEKQRYVQK